MKKSSTFIHIKPVIYVSVVFFTLSFGFVACQTDDLNRTDEIAQDTYIRVKNARIQREYAEAFSEEFGTPDLTQDWTYKPLTVYHSGSNTDAASMTRTVTSPVITYLPKDSALVMSYSKVKTLLNAVPEKAYNYDHMHTNIGYYADQETVYDIYPVMWGEKFCDNNIVGLFTFELDANGTPDKNTIQDWGTIWQDNNNGQTNVFMRYTNEIGTFEKEFPVNTHPINMQNTMNNGESGQTLMTVKENIWIGNGYKERYKDVEPQEILFPHYQVTVPAGTYWGIYLETKKDQNLSDRVKWYSVACFNYNNTEPAGNINIGGDIYLCFEDAPVKGAMDGGRVDGYQGYDKDYNDICLLITPRPIESSFSVDEVRVMCEDLGGSFDWDFNDIVYDIKITQRLYYDSKNNPKNATATITLQAVGGTLPVNIIIDGQNYGEMHTLLGQKPSSDDLFTPVLTGQSKEITTIDLKSVDVDAVAKLKEIASKIQIVVSDPKDQTTHIVNFPNPFGDKNPQCFMCQSGIQWSDETVKITDTYPAFAQWVQHSTVDQWWNAEKYTNQQQEEIIR